MIITEGSQQVKFTYTGGRIDFYVSGYKGDV